MKLTKKAAALLLAASLAVSVCATPVFATGTTPLEMGPLNVKGTSPLGIGVGHTNVLYKVTESYSWSVPTTIDFGENAGVGNTSTVEANLSGSKAKGDKAQQEAEGKAWKGTAPRVEVIKNVIGVGKSLQIAVSTDARENVTIDDTGFYVQSGTEKLYFTITKPGATPGGTEEKLTKDNTKVLSVPSGTDTDEQELVFTLNTADNTAGNVAEKAGEYKGYVVFSSSIVG